MGLRIHTVFETPEGFPVSSVYCRIVSFTYNLASRDVTLHHECYYDRERRLQGFRRLYTPGISESYTVRDTDLPTMASLYASLKTTLLELGLTVEDVDPDPAPAPEG